MHVRETNTVNQLQKKLTEQELVFLKINMLELYNQTIAVIEEQIKGLQKKLKSNLHNAESFIKGSIVEANSQAGSLPMQWLQQEKIAMFKEMNIKVMTELVKTIESKNIAQNIERMESAAIDEARAPLMPERPQLFLWASFGLVAGLIGSLFTCVFIEIKKGLVATEHNLELQGYTALGELKESPEDIDTVRRAISFINQHAHLKTIYIIGDTFKKPFELLAHLLAIQGERVLFLEASCFDPNETSGGKDFELYLIGQNPEVPTPESLQEGYHKLKMGEYSAFATEFMNTHKFKDLLESFVNVYDKIIIFIPLDPVKTVALTATANAEILLVVSKERRLTELAPYIALDKPVGFFL